MANPVDELARLSGLPRRTLIQVGFGLLLLLIGIGVG